MTINGYLENTAFATQQLFKLLEELVEKRNNLINLKATAPIHLRNAQTFDAFSKQVKANGNIEESYDFLKRAFDKYYQHQIALSTIKEIEGYYSDKILIANGPIQVIGQAILQIAKQGLSSTYHTSLRSIKSGLMHLPRSILDTNNNSIKIHHNGITTINDITILDVIWQGRNQSIHYEGTVFQDVKDVFEPLSSDFPSLVGYNNNENKAYEIISKILHWNTYEDYRLDMEKLV